MNFKIKTSVMTLLTLASALLTPITQANAFSPMLVSYVTTQEMSLDLGCGKDNITDVSFRYGQLPPGLTMNSSGVVSGVPVTEGYYTLSDRTCVYNNGQESEFLKTHVIFKVTQPAGQTTFVTVKNLNTDTCSFYISELYTSEPGAISVKISNQSGSELVSNYPGAQIGGIVESEIDLELLNTAAQLQPDYNTFTGAPFACGDVLNFTYTLGNDGEPKTNINIWGIRVTSPSGGPMFAEQILGKECSVQVVVPVSNIAEGTWLQFTDPTTGNRDAGIQFEGDAVANGQLISEISLSNSEENRSTHDIIQSQDSGITCGGTWVMELIDPIKGTTHQAEVTVVAQLPGCTAGQVIVPNDFSCEVAAKGTYTSTMNNVDSTDCPADMTTLTTGSTSVNDCYKPLSQTISGFKAPKALKYGSVANLAITTNTKALAKYKVSGPCTAKVANVVTTVKGKKVTTKMLKVTASKKAGTCSVTLTSAAKDKYLAMSKPLKIKVSKTGK